MNSPPFKDTTGYRHIAYRWMRPLLRGYSNSHVRWAPGEVYAYDEFRPGEVFAKSLSTVGSLVTDWELGPEIVAPIEIAAIAKPWKSPA